LARVWITGGRGFIGRHLARHLAHEGHSVAGLGHGLWSSAEAGAWGFARWVDGGLDASNLTQLLRDDGVPDVIHHLAGGSSVGAAFANPHEDFARTVASTAALLDWLRLNAPTARIVIVSSAAVYGAGHVGQITEGAPTQPYSPYGAHKLMMEDLARSYAANFGLAVVIVRLFSVYGIWLRKQLLWELCQRFDAGAGSIELQGDGGELRDWTHASDVARLLARAAEIADAAAPMVNGGSGRGVDVERIARLVAAEWPGRADVRFSGRSRAGDPRSLVADPARITGLGFAFQVPIEAGVRDYVEWYRASPRADV
jgi:UDP-glucose 4-epimerase